MKVRWQVRIQNGSWMCGTHTFRSRKDALIFIAQWRKNEEQCDASAELLRNGKVQS